MAFNYIIVVRGDHNIHLGGLGGDDFGFHGVLAQEHLAAVGLVD